MLPLSTILIFEFEIVPTVWYFVLCSFYSYYDFCWYIFFVYRNCSRCDAINWV